MIKQIGVLMGSGDTFEIRKLFGLNDKRMPFKPRPKCTGVPLNQVFSQTGMENPERLPSSASGLSFTENRQFMLL